MDLMCFAHRSDPYGVVMAKDTPESRKKIAKMLSISPRTFDSHLANLIQMSRICYNSEQGLQINRMVRDHEKWRKDSENGKKGGNPALKGDNPPLKAEKRREDYKEPLTPSGRDEGVPSETEKPPPEKPPPKPKPKPKPKERDRGVLITYGEFENVHISPVEYEKLKKAQGEARLREAIELIGNWKESTGKKYRNDYSAMKSDSWVWDRVKGHKTNPNCTPVNQLDRPAPGEIQ